MLCRWPVLLKDIPALVDSKEFRELLTPHVESGKSHRHLEMLGVEIKREDGEQKLHFINSEGQTTFTPSASAIDDLLRKIEKLKGTRVMDAKQTVCLTSA